MARRFAALLLLLSLTTAAALVYSPLHQHSRISNQSCNLSQYGATTCLQAASHVEIEPPVLRAHLPADTRTAAPAEASVLKPCGRAPPA